MDVNALLQLVQDYGLVLIPTTLGLSEVAKRLIPPVKENRWASVVSLVIAVALSLIVIGVENIGNSVMVGLIIGLSASGLWSVGKVAVNTVSTKPKVGILILVVPAIMSWSCATIMPEARTPQDKIVYAKTTITGANNAVAEMLNTGTLSLEAAEEYRETVTEANTLLEVYEGLISDGDESMSDLDKWFLLETLLNKINNKYILRIEEGGN